VMTIRRVGCVIVIAALAAALATGCEWRGLNTFALPGTEGNRPGSFTVQA